MGKRQSQPEDQELATRFHRLMDILSRVERPQGANAEDLASSYGLSVRSIQRDIALLRYAAFDIDPPRNGLGYRLAPGGASLPRTLAMDELLSVVLAMRCLQDSGDERLAEINDRAMTKLFSLMRGPSRAAASTLLPSVEVARQREQPWLPELLRATSQRVSVRFNYRGRGKEEWTQRTVDPYTLLYQSEVWFLQGWCHVREALRTFRLQRMEALELTEHPFHLPDGRSQEPAAFHPWDLVEGPAFSVVCKVDRDLERWLEESPVHPSQRIDNGHVHLKARDLQRVASWVLSLENARAVEPPELRQILRERVLQLAESYA